jgi:hypothetical protein
MSTLARLNLVLLGALLAGACNQHGGRVYAASQEPVVNNGIPPSRRSVTERSKRDAIDAGEPRPRRHPRLPDEDTSGEGFYEPIIDINVAAVGAKVVFRFRAREVSGEVYEPTVKSIELWKKGDKQLTCEFRSSGVRLSEWQYGAVLERFENLRCIPLTAGDYELNVRGLGGSGRIQVRVDEQGRVTALPWYGQSKLPWDGK